MPVTSRVYAPSTICLSPNNTLHTNYLEDAVTTVNYLKYKEITLNYPPLNSHGSMRTFFQMKTTSGVGSALGKIYRNGSPIGTEHTTVGAGYEDFTDDFYFTDLQQGDTFELWAHRAHAGDAVWVRDFELRATLSNMTNTME